MNLTLGGAGAGLYLLGMLFIFIGHRIPAEVQFVSFQFLAPVIVCCGFLALTMEAGRPMRAYHLLANLSGSWMSIETLVGGLFIVFSLVSRFYPYPIFEFIAVLSALIFMMSQGFIVYRAVAVPAWNVWLTPVIFMTSGFMTACGLVLLNIQIHSGTDSLLTVIFLICIFLNLTAWLMYLYRYHDNHFQKAVKFMRHPVLLLLIVGLGHLIPFVLLFSTLVSHDVESGSNVMAVFRVISGLALVGGGLSQKSGIILIAGYYRSIVLNR